MAFYSSTGAGPALGFGQRNPDIPQGLNVINLERVPDSAFETHPLSPYPSSGQQMTIAATPKGALFFTIRGVDDMFSRGAGLGDENRTGARNTLEGAYAPNATSSDSIDVLMDKLTMSISVLGFAHQGMKERHEDNQMASAMGGMLTTSNTSDHAISAGQDVYWGLPNPDSKTQGVFFDQGVPPAKYLMLGPREMICLYFDPARILTRVLNDHTHPATPVPSHPSRHGSTHRHASTASGSALALDVSCARMAGMLVYMAGVLMDVDANTMFENLTSNREDLGRKLTAAVDNRDLIKRIQSEPPSSKKQRLLELVRDRQKQPLITRVAAVVSEFNNFMVHQRVGTAARSAKPGEDLKIQLSI